MGNGYGRTAGPAVRAAEAEKAARIAEVNSTMQAWQTQLRLDITTDADKYKSSLTAWMKYVQAVDTASAPHIALPEEPAS